MMKLEMQARILKKYLKVLEIKKAKALQEYDTGNAVPDYQEPQQLYLDLSWEGLIYENNPNTAVTAWTSLPQSESDRIRLVISDYINSNSN